MKAAFCISVFLITFASSAQNYELFNAYSKKLFTTYPTAGLTSGIAFDSVFFAGDYTFYYNYTGIDSLFFLSDTCQFWTGNQCIQQNRPLWFGSSVTGDFMNTYTFRTAENIPITFNFGPLTVPGDSSLFYHDSTQNFFIAFKGTDTATILAFPDSVKFYRIAHYDNSGTEIDSPLNDFQIMIGKQMGLASFFRIDSFPAMEQPLVLAGNLSPEAGLTSLTEAMIYDYQVGDIIEYFEYYYQMDGPPWNNYSRYVKQLFFNRTETDDLVYYFADRTIYYPDSNTLFQDTVILTIDKNHVYAEIPFDKINQDQNLQLTRLYNGDYCGLSLWTYRIEPQYKTYCAIDNCWGDFDIPGPPPVEEWIYACGLGLYYFQSDLVAPPPEGYVTKQQIVYFKKGEVECGEDIITGLFEHAPGIPEFMIYPNPAKDILYVKTNGSCNGQLIISNIQGQTISKITVGPSITEINISDLKEGLYFIKYLKNSTVEIARFLKTN